MRGGPSVFRAVPCVYHFREGSTLKPLHISAKSSYHPTTMDSANSMAPMASLVSSRFFAVNATATGSGTASGSGSSTNAPNVVAYSSTTDSSSSNTPGDIAQRSVKRLKHTGTASGTASAQHRDDSHQQRPDSDDDDAPLMTLLPLASSARPPFAFSNGVLRIPRTVIGGRRPTLARVAPLSPVRNESVSASARAASPASPTAHLASSNHNGISTNNKSNPVVSPIVMPKSASHSHPPVAVMPMAMPKSTAATPQSPSAPNRPLVLPVISVSALRPLPPPPPPSKSASMSSKSGGTSTAASVASSSVSAKSAPPARSTSASTVSKSGSSKRVTAAPEASALAAKNASTAATAEKRPSSSSKQQAPVAAAYIGAKTGQHRDSTLSTAVAPKPTNSEPLKSATQPESASIERVVINHQTADAMWAEFLASLQRSADARARQQSSSSSSSSSSLTAPGKKKAEPAFTVSELQHLWNTFASWQLPMASPAPTSSGELPLARRVAKHEAAMAAASSSSSTMLVLSASSPSSSSSSLSAASAPPSSLAAAVRLVDAHRDPEFAAVAGLMDLRHQLHASAQRTHERRVALAAQAAFDAELQRARIESKWGPDGIAVGGGGGAKRKGQAAPDSCVAFQTARFIF